MNDYPNIVDLPKRMYCVLRIHTIPSLVEQEDHLVQVVGFHLWCVQQYFRNQSHHR